MFVDEMLHRFSVLCGLLEVGQTGGAIDDAESLHAIIDAALVQTETIYQNFDWSMLFAPPEIAKYFEEMKLL